MKNSAAKITSKRPAYWALSSAMTLMLVGITSAWAGDGPTPNAPDKECGLSTQQQEMLALVNEARSQARQCGDQQFAATEPLTWNCKLARASQLHAEDMAENDYVSHTSPDGSGIEQRINNQGYPWQAVGENIAAGQLSAAAVVEGWLESPGHCSNIMNATFTEIGMASAQNADSQFTTYWAQALGNAR
ncbi:CAP domain-containing protein [Halomonas qaidamensis]|uniref:CAP domain-containing protein n=2 Tax=Halomonadaceae TaxID=28256 RepID=A0ABY6JNE7_9GAMM|nr:CAP domain-containing protein [Halomonas qaidamensis]